MSSINQLISKIKENEQDFEWYPTTLEIVKRLASKLAIKKESEIHSILDIGCGNGGFFEKLDLQDCFSDSYNSVYRGISKNYKKYGIEKSSILSANASDDIIMLGTDFNQQTLIDKEVDLIFCNPPYSEYVEWTEKIIKESNSKFIALVIPERWENNERIKIALESRKMIVENLGTFDFSNAERKARATVNLLWVYSDRYDKVNPFDLWFDSTFKISADKEKVYEYDEREKRKEQIDKEIVEAGNLADTLVNLYNADMQKLYSNYKTLENLDSSLFRELNINIQSLKESLKKRLQGLKHLYWDMLFKRYELITNRLTSKCKERVINRLNQNTAIDFTKENIFQLTQWIIKHSNTLFDEQITDFFYELCNSENIHRYKSNKRWNDDNWKYIKQGIDDLKKADSEKRKAILKGIKNIQLDYRIVCTNFRNFKTDWSGKYYEGLCFSTIEFLNDIKIIAKNLGFNLENFYIPQYESERVDVDLYSNFDLKYQNKTFCNIKLYKNGNRHLKFCKEFMQKLNIEMARINHWIQDKSEVSEEFDIKKDDVNKYWNCNHQIKLENFKNLLGFN